MALKPHLAKMKWASQTNELGKPQFTADIVQEYKTI